MRLVLGACLHEKIKAGEESVLVVSCQSLFNWQFYEVRTSRVYTTNIISTEGAKVSKYVNEVPDKDKGSLLRLRED